MTERTVEVHIAAKRLQLHPSSVRRMFHRGLLDGYLTGVSMTRIRIFESSLQQHMQQINAQEKQ